MKPDRNENALRPIAILAVVLLAAVMQLRVVIAQNGRHLIPIPVAQQDSKSFLPNIVESALSYYEGFWETEPNFPPERANGPLLSDVSYRGYPDLTDYFTFHMATDGHVKVTLTEHVGSEVQLQLYYRVVEDDPPVADDRGTPGTIEYDGPAGLYYIYIYTGSGHSNTVPYNLRVVYPSIPTPVPAGSTATPTPSSSPLPTSTPTLTPSPTATSTHVSTPSPTPTATHTPSSWVGYTFNESTENWVTSEGEYKLAELSISDEEVFEGGHSLKLVTELYYSLEDTLFSHTEAVAYFNNAVPQGKNGPGPYDLSGVEVSCQVFIPQDLILSSKPQAYVDLFVKDSVNRNHYSKSVDITAATAGSWVKLAFVAGAAGYGHKDPNFDASKSSALGFRIMFHNDAELHYTGPLYIDECRLN